MKKIFIAALAVCAAFTSCSEEENNNVTGETAKLTIGVSAPLSTREVGQLTDNTDNKIGEFKAFVFAGNSLQAVVTSGDGTTVTTADVTTAANAIYVIANANNASELSGISKGSISKTAFLALAGNLINGSSMAAKSTLGNVWASGFEPIASGDFVGADREAAKNVSVSPVPARINVTVNDQRIKQTDPAAFKITNVQVLYAPGATPFIKPANFVSPATWYTGYDQTNAPATYSVYFDDVYDASGHRFYTFENDASVNPTIVTLVTTRNNTDKRYYPVQFTDDDAACTIERGKSYQVAITLTGDATDDTEIIDPEEPVLSAKIDVSVTPEDWIPVVVNKEF